MVKNTQSNNSAHESHFFGITLFCCSRHTTRNFVVVSFIEDVNTLPCIFFLNYDAVSQNSFSGKFAYIYDRLRVEMIRIAFLVA